MKRSGMSAGKPFRSGGRGPSLGKILGILVSLGLIIAAVCIVISIVNGGKDKGKPPVSPAESAAVEESISPEQSENKDGEDGTPVPSGAPSDQAGSPTEFRLNRDDFTLSYQGEVFYMEALFTPENTKTLVTWKSSDPNIASVSWNGVVAGVSPGQVTITATAEGLGTRECTVRCDFTENSTAPNVPSGNTSGLSLNRDDFTLGHQGEVFRLIVSGTASPAVWSIENPEVATIEGDGTVTAVGVGVTTATATVDSVTLKCVVRCRW